jgi:formamidopyrimidine-DNA glycosylase
MPELPEVHRAERACNANVVGKKIVKVEAVWPIYFIY